MAGETKLVVISLFFYLAGGGLLCLSAHRNRGGSFSVGLIAGGVLFHTIALVARVIKSGHLPMSSLYEFIIVLSWVLAITSLFLQPIASYIRGSLPVLSAFLLTVALTQSSVINPLPPALRSYWLQVHVLFAVTAYSAFALGFVLSFVWLLKLGDRCEELWGKNDRMLYRVILLGFSFHTLVLITGAIWAEQTWGSWWSWDPKETWALITWLIYAYYLHRRLEGNLRGRSGAWFGLMGFAVVMFTLFGVSLWLPGMHSYK